MTKRFSLFKKKPTVAKQIAPGGKLDDELNTITHNIANDAKRKMEAYVRQQLKHYNAATNPMGKEDAQKILNELIRIAVDTRQNINSDVELSISEGNMYRRYYNKVSLINELTNETYMKMEYMKAAEERYEYKKQVYNNVTGNMYLNRVVHAVQPTVEPSAPKDPNIEIEKEGERQDEKICDFD